LNPALKELKTEALVGAERREKPREFRSKKP
jgi:hypothetical protein